MNNSAMIVGAVLYLSVFAACARFYKGDSYYLLVAISAVAFLGIAGLGAATISRLAP